MKNNRDTVKELVDIYIKAEKEGKSLSNYLYERFNDNDIERYSHLFDKCREQIVDRLQEISEGIANISKLSKGNKSVLSMDFANLYTDKLEEKIEIVYEIEESINQSHLFATLAEYFNKKDELLKGSISLKESFKESAERYYTVMSDLVEAKRTHSTKDIKRLTSKLATEKQNIRYLTGYAKPDVKNKMDLYINDKITELMNKTQTARKVVKRIKKQKIK